MCLSSQLWQEANGRITVQVDLGKKRDTIIKIIRVKRAEGMAQVELKPASQA
jgi:hypothetical protein